MKAIATSTSIFFNNALKNTEISEERKSLLTSIAHYIVKERKGFHKVKLNFICTHNSRRSQLAQVWAHYATEHYKLKRIKSYSGGTEVTAFHKNSIAVLQKVGFSFKLFQFSHDNPIYKIYFDGVRKPITGFSKLYDDSVNKKPFIALTTCAAAEANCPFIPEALIKFHLGYTDPKSYDYTEFKEDKYEEINEQIAGELHFLFKTVATLL